MATYAIGDIQGCYQQLEQLLNKIQFNSDTDKLWFTGDLINRGPDSLATLRLLYSLRDNVTTVLGNHDLHLLATAFHHKRPGKKDTLTEILEAPDRLQLLDWLRHQPLIHHDSDLDVTILHAGIHPDWSIAKAQALSSEVLQILRDDTQYVRFYQHMYGDKPNQWSEKLNSWPRFRFITNVLTRLRYCDTSGRLALGPKGAPGTQAEGFHPWYEIENRVSRNDRIIFGHWSTLDYESDIYTKHNVFPIDTGCLWGGKLTALRIDVEPFVRIQLDCPVSKKPTGLSKTKKKNTGAIRQGT